MSGTVGGSEVHAVYPFMFGLQLKKSQKTFYIREREPVSWFLTNIRKDTG